jgi:DNA polymerase III epsilon subunit-like protein
MKKIWEEVYISVDIEASGPIPGEYSMLSLGACVVENPTKTFYIEFKPINKNSIERAMSINNLSMDKLLKDGVEPVAAMAQLEEWVLRVVDGKRPILVAHNASFDWMFTHWYFIKFLGRDPLGISGIDIKAYYMGKFNSKWGETTKKKMDPRVKSTKLHTHNALDDAIEQAEIFEKLLKHKS